MSGAQLTNLPPVPSLLAPGASPSTTAYSAIQRLFSRNETRRWARENFARCAVTKAEYDELGADGLARRRRQVREWDARWAGWDG